MSIKNLLGDFRKWLDGEDAVSLAPESPPARREWEEFLVSVAREVETAMQKEMFTPPGGPTYIPREYMVFLSKEDDSQWQGDKRDDGSPRLGGDLRHNRRGAGARAPAQAGHEKNQVRVLDDFGDLVGVSLSGA